ncbi:MAG: hypothetical protein WKF97_09855 [Chitinophagaceae bacterium]
MKNSFPIITHINKKRAGKNVISLREAIRYTKVYQRIIKHNKAELEKLIFPYAESFDRNAIALLLKQKGAEGIRVYLGVDEAGETGKEVKLVLVPVDKKGKDIVVHLLDEKWISRPPVQSAEQDFTQQDEEDDYYSVHDEARSQQFSAQGPSALDAEDEKQTVNSGQRCPHVCDEDSDLNRPEE